jgi:hypothetical protein
MPNILTAQQAANALRTTTTDARMLDLLPQVDAFVKRATGRDWAADATMNSIAVSAATMLLVMWYENPGMIGMEGVMPFGLTAALGQLEAEALKYRKHVFDGLNGAGAVSLPSVRRGDDVISLVGIYGVSGSQTANFESEISEDGQLQQTSTDDLSENVYAVIVKSPEDDVT